MDDRAPWLESRHILVVEDDALVAIGLVSYLEELGATVMWATDIPNAVGWIEHCSKIDVAIVDLNLDGSMSTPVVDRLIAKEVFTILCTGYEVGSIEERFRGLPRSEKPFTRAKIRNLLAIGV
ncbi:response regulator [Sphingomonas sp. PsM26]|jgi:CheY-like chemotaxis protein|nr:response regulator [Sphingomonas sp. PsM26]